MSQREQGQSRSRLDSWGEKGNPAVLRTPGTGQAASPSLSNPRSSYYPVPSCRGDYRGAWGLSTQSAPSSPPLPLPSRPTFLSRLFRWNLTSLAF